MYLVVDEATGTAAVVDPWDATKINAAAAEQGVKVGIAVQKPANVGSPLTKQTGHLAHHHTPPSRPLGR
jgi:hypothetical protein